MSISTLSHSASATPSASNVHQVPSDLIPVHRKSLTVSYASKTKNWARSFDCKRFQSLYENDEDTDLIIEWQNYMINIQTELKDIGYDNACQMIVNMFVLQYEIRDPVTKQYPKSFADVLKIIENTLWYTKNVIKSRNILWMALYGIFRRNLDRWIETLAQKWKAGKKIEEFSITKFRSGVGFVQQNLMYKASTNIQRRIKSTMWYHHGEEICCKRKLPKDKGNLCETKILCHGYDAYLYTRAHSKDALAQINLSVKNAIHLNVAQEDIMKCVKESIELHEQNKTSEHQSGM